MENLDTMQMLPPDIKRQIALDLSPPDLISLCVTGKINMKDICESKEFWLEKLKRDYPESLLITYRDNLPLINPKRTYIRKFQEVSKVIEEAAKISGVSYDKIYKVYNELLFLKIHDTGNYHDRTISQKYDIEIDKWNQIRKILTKLFIRQKRYFKEAEEAKTYF